MLTQPNVVIVGGGPAGLTAAAALAPRVDGSVLVLEREGEAGGIPRHSDHTGYGIRDRHRLMRGPAYARSLVDNAVRRGAVIETHAMVTGWTADGRLQVTAPSGRFEIDAPTVVLATGARERPRAARLVAGDRPAGVYTTGQLQNLVHVQGAAVGKRAVIVGAELVSWSAALTLRHAGCQVAAMLTEFPKSDTYAAVRALGRIGLRMPVRAHSTIVRINGRGRVESVDVRDERTGAVENLACDTVIFTADWIPDNELARLGGIDIDPGTKGPVVDTSLRTSTDGVFAIGNLLHPVDTADVAALDGRHVARFVLDHLAKKPVDGGGSVAVTARHPLTWIAPQRLSTRHRPPRGYFSAWSSELIRTPTVVVRQGGEEIARRRLLWPAAPGRILRIPASVFDDVDFERGTVDLSIH